MPNPQYTWETIRAALRRLWEFNVDFLPNTVLVGGAACWYYRQAIIQIADPDFPAPEFSPEEEKLWVSKDLDFMGDSDAEISELIGRKVPPMGEPTDYGGVVLDFVDEGLILRRREANQTARKVELADLLFYVADPALLYAEKQALVRSKSRAQDGLHSRALAQFIKWEFCRAVKDRAVMDPKAWLNAAKTVKTANLAFFAGDPKFCRLLHDGSQGLAAEHRAVFHWIRHQVPAPKD